MTRRGSRLLAFVLLLTSCSGGEYSIVVRFESQTLADQVDRVEVYLVDSCGALGDTGAAPVGAGGRLDLRRGMTTTTFSAVSAGAYGLYGRGFDGSTCQVVAAGCTSVTLEAGGEGELVVTLGMINGPLCPAGMPCVDGVCGVADAAVPDGGMDATPDAPVDSAVPCSCVACARCDDAGACIADSAACGAGMYCDLVTGCTSGDPCSDDTDCPDDGNPCTSTSCDPGLGICVPTAATDGTSCSDDIGRAGQCRAGRCCTGCWDGGDCVPGNAAASCGAAGDRCTSCDDGNACTTDACGGGTCSSSPTDGACPGGTCFGGMCCTGCVGVSGCNAGDTAAACGMGGARCATCDASACPPESCSSGMCMPLGATSVVTRRLSFYAIAPDGSLWDWGLNSSAELGLGDTTNRTVPTQVGTATDWAQAGAGRNHACAVKTSGQLWCWGQGGSGRLGLGGTASVTVPTRVGTDSDWAMVTGGDEHTCAIKTSGQLWCWGGLANGSGGASLVPTRVGTESDWSFANARSDHTCGIRAGGQLWCWGDNQDGQLGVGDTVARTTPTRVGTATTWLAVATGGSLGAGGAFTCALQTDGSRWCWGENGFLRRFGDAGSTASSTAPVRIDGGPWRAVAAGARHACAIAMDRSLYCWGDNADLATGQATAGAVAPPAQVGTSTNYTSVAAGSASTCAVQSTGAVRCFGNNGSGELGRPGGSSASPVRACL